MSAALADHLLPRPAATPSPGDPGLDGLTPTEREVLRLIAHGKSTKEIGGTLRTSPKTVENHRSNICRKLGVHGTNALTRFALEHRDRIV